MEIEFEWDEEKSQLNYYKHKIDFRLAKKAFKDTKSFITEDKKHSNREDRYFCYGKVGKKIITVRFTYRDGKIRIFGAGYWRDGKEIYEEKNDS